MPIRGYVDYRSREFCKDVKCPVQVRLNELERDSEEYEKVREACRTTCRHSAREFHYWLMGNGFSIVRPEKEVSE